MKQGGNRQRASGFTIVEVLIVLAVTGLLFVSAVAYISGRQDKTEFMTAINGAQQQFQQLINETQSGYYGSTNFSCHGNKNGTAPTINGRDSNTGCIFLGRVISDSGSGLVVYPVIGNQQFNNRGVLQQVSTLAQAAPTPGPASTYTPLVLDNGLSVGSVMSVVAGSMTPAGAMGIITSLANYTGSNCNGGLCSGAQQFRLYSINTQGVFTPVDSMQLCLASGTTNQSGLISISGQGSLSVTLSISEGNKTCATT